MPTLDPQTAFLVVPFAEREQLRQTEHIDSPVVAATPYQALTPELRWPIAVFEVAISPPYRRFGTQLQVGSATITAERTPSIVFGSRGKEVLHALQAALALPAQSWQWLAEVDIAESPTAIQASVVVGDLANQETCWQEVAEKSGYGPSYQLLRSLIRALIEQLRQQHDGLGPVVVAWFVHAAAVTLLLSDELTDDDQANLCAPWLALQTGQPLALAL
jgi:hypothetical protein